MIGGVKSSDAPGFADCACDCGTLVSLPASQLSRSPVLRTRFEGVCLLDMMIGFQDSAGLVAQKPSVLSGYDSNDAKSPSLRSPQKEAAS